MKRMLIIVMILSIVWIMNIFAQTQVWTADDLNNVRNNLSGDYIQMADIDLDVANYNVGEGWFPIGTSNAPFMGTYNGDGFTISGLYINTPAGDPITDEPQGLFGVTQNATIWDLGITDVNILAYYDGYDNGIGSDKVGGLIGHAIDTKVYNCYTGEGDIEIDYGDRDTDLSEESNLIEAKANVGGLIGLLEGTQLVDDEYISYVKNSHNTLMVIGRDRVGGLVGTTGVWSGPGPTGYSWIYRSYNAGNVYDDDKVGGLVGVHAYGSLIEECYSTGIVSGLEQVGGLVGDNYGKILNSFKVCTQPVTGEYVGGLVGWNWSTGEIINCYSNGVVNPTGGGYAGGLVGMLPPGQSDQYGTVTNSYWDIATSGINPADFPWYGQNAYGNGSLGEARNTMQMTLADYYDPEYPDIDTYIDWDFVDIWMDDDDDINRGYPLLRYVYFNFNYDCDPGDPQPVELSSFNATVVASGAVSLEWRAETETNMLGYNVYRSMDDVLANSVKINHSVISAFNSSTAVDYSYLDEEVVPGNTYYYWLQAKDFDLSTSFFGPLMVTLDEDPVIPPTEYVTRLLQNHPNPFNPETNIIFSLDKDVDMMELKIYNVMGQLIRTLHEGPHNEGEYLLSWDGRDNNGNVVTSGVYFYRMTTSNYHQVHKMMLLK